MVAPGFIDLHAHGQDNVSNALQARDGVTTALDLELGAYPVEEFYVNRRDRAILHYGVSVGHIPTRISVMTGLSGGHLLTRDYYAPWYQRWIAKLMSTFLDPVASTREPATDAQIDEMVDGVSKGLDDGGLGIGFGLDYTPGATEEEIRRLFAVAAQRGVLCDVHMRGPAAMDDMCSMEELLRLAKATGASVHVAHLPSSSQHRIGSYSEMIEAAHSQGLDITAEMYPYTAASTRIESAFFDEGFRERWGIDYDDIRWPATGERLDERSFQKYRKQGGFVVFDMVTPAILDDSIASPLLMIASDGVPMFNQGLQHPRGAGTYARVLGRFVRERGLLGLMAALEKMTLMPARRLEGFVPAMRRKGRLRVGADADITVFDPERVTDRATYSDPRRPSVGIPHVLVGGSIVVRNSQLVPGVFPGKPVRAPRVGR